MPSARPPVVTTVFVIEPDERAPLFHRFFGWAIREWRSQHEGSSFPEIGSGRKVFGQADADVYNSTGAEVEAT